MPKTVKGSIKSKLEKGGGTMNEKTKILDEAAISRAIKRISHEILEKNKGTEDLLLVGIKTRGTPLANRIQQQIKEIEGVDVETGELDISLYRDDLSNKDTQDEATVNQTNITSSIQGKKVILLDDVLYTGRTVRAAMDAIIDLGRPKNVQLGVLIDRGHRELPIRADYVGKNIPTSTNEAVSYTHLTLPTNREV